VLRDALERDADGLAVARDVVENAEPGPPKRQHRADHVGDADAARDRSGDPLARLPRDAAVEIVEQLGIARFGEDRLGVEPVRFRELEVAANALHGDGSPFCHVSGAMMHAPEPGINPRGRRLPAARVR
jgi:hypothetical protein